MQENQNPLCKYKNLFGKLGEGIHSYRIFNFAIMDTLQTILLGFFLAWLTRYPIYYTIPGSFLLGIIAHRLFCVRTTVDKLLFPEV
jgi:hypothetical protein